MMEYLRISFVEMAKILRVYGIRGLSYLRGRGMLASSRISVDILQLGTIGFQICIQLVTNLPLLNCLSH
jgi:hypothetical protein